MTKAPREPVYQYHLGIAQLQAGNPIAARRSLERALALNPEFPNAADSRRTLSSITAARPAPDPQ